MTKFGYAASLEEFSPRESIEQAELAEAAGFHSIWVNDHFHPWFDQLATGESSHGGNCWSWLPAVAERTEDIRIGTGVTAILNRYHPANVAHRLATLMELYPDRVFLGLGTGESLNELPLGYRFPSYTERVRRTVEAIDIIRTLFQDEYVDYEGEFWTLDGANLFTGPQTPPPIYVAAGGPNSAKLAGDVGDGFMTVNKPPEELERDLLPAFRDGIRTSDRNDSAESVDTILHIQCSFAEDRQRALEHARTWRVTLQDGVYESETADPRRLRESSESISDDAIERSFVIASDPQEFIDVFDRYVEIGFDRIIVQSSSPDQARFFETMATEVMPSF